MKASQIYDTFVLLFFHINSLTYFRPDWGKENRNYRHSGWGEQAPKTDGRTLYSRTSSET